MIHRRATRGWGDVAACGSRAPGHSTSTDLDKVDCPRCREEVVRRSIGKLGGATEFVGLDGKPFDLEAAFGPQDDDVSFDTDLLSTQETVTHLLVPLLEDPGECGWGPQTPTHMGRWVLRCDDDDRLSAGLDEATTNPARVTCEDCRARVVDQSIHTLKG